MAFFEATSGGFIQQHTFCEATTSGGFGQFSTLTYLMAFFEATSGGFTQQHTFCEAATSGGFGQPGK